jgi:hypothetical protein
MTFHAGRRIGALSPCSTSVRNISILAYAWYIGLVFI